MLPFSRSAGMSGGCARSTRCARCSAADRRNRRRASTDARACGHVITTVSATNSRATPTPRQRAGVHGRVHRRADQSSRIGDALADDDEDARVGRQGRVAASTPRIDCVATEREQSAKRRGTRRAGRDRRIAVRRMRERAHRVVRPRVVDRHERVDVGQQRRERQRRHFAIAQARERRVERTFDRNRMSGARRRLQACRLGRLDADHFAVPADETRTSSRSRTAIRRRRPERTPHRSLIPVRLIPDP